MASVKSLIVIAGPTASGKTELAIKVARQLHTEVISADSRQFYREMSIGTAKPSPQELEIVPHHFINSLSITDDYTAGDFEREGLRVLDAIFRHNSYAVLAGGSGLFIKAITEGFDELPGPSSDLRKNLNTVFSEQGLLPLQQQLKELDPEYFHQVDLNNPKRVIRALEVCLATGKPFSALRHSSKKVRNFKCIKIGLDIHREALYERINQRVDQMVKNGLFEEAESLFNYRHLNALNTVGYAEIFTYMEGKTTREEAINAIKQNTRRYAKRQLTWFRKDPDIKWFSPAQAGEIIEYIMSGTTRPARTE